jgi:hypothetical protein
LVLDDADDDGFFSNTSAYAEKNLLFVIVSEFSMSSPLPVVVFVVFLVVVLSKPAPLLAKVPKRFPLLISFPSSSSHRRDDDFPTPFPPHEEREEDERDKGEQGDTAEGPRPPFRSVRRINTFIKDIISFLLLLLFFPCAWGKSAVLDRRVLHKERAHLFSLSLSLSLSLSFSSGICRALRGGE